VGLRHPVQHLSRRSSIAKHCVYVHIHNIYIYGGQYSMYGHLLYIRDKTLHSAWHCVFESSRIYTYVVSSRTTVTCCIFGTRPYTVRGTVYMIRHVFIHMWYRHEHAQCDSIYDSPYVYYIHILYTHIHTCIVGNTACGVTCCIFVMMPYAVCGSMYMYRHVYVYIYMCI